MIDDEEARALFDGVVALIVAHADNRLARVVSDVRVVVAEGRPIGKQQKRERVRGVVPLTPREQLAVLVDAIEFALVTPVDLALATVKALTVDNESLDLVFETDSATENSPLDRTFASRSGIGGAGSVVVSAAEVGTVVAAVQPLREALDAIRQELTR